MATRPILAFLALTTLACGGVARPPPAPPPVEEPPEPDAPDAPPAERDGPSPDEQVDGPERGIPTPRPAPGQRVEPVFVRPFEGDYPTSGFLDHRRKGGVGQTTPWGTQVWGRPGHNGHDYVMPVGTPLFAVADGTVRTAGELGPACGAEPAIVVQLDHDALIDGQDYRTVYWHLNKVAVAEGAKVEAGTLIGYSGNTGCSSGPHLHFGVLRLGDEGKKSRLVDPYGWAGEGTDPLDGRSTFMWREGQAPALFRIAIGPDRSIEGPQVVRMVATIWRNDPEGEYVEVGMARNNPKATLDIGGWSLGDAEGEVRWSFPKGTTVRAGEVLRISSGKGSGGVLGMRRDRTAWDGDGECVELRDETGRVIDRLGYGKQACP